MNEIEFLRDARPVASGPGQELARRLRGDLIADITTARQKQHRSARRRFAIAVTAVAPIAAAVVVVFTLLGGNSDTAWASAVRVAQAAPRLLVGEPGWAVTRADEFSVDYGEMTFSRGDLQLDLRWVPGSDHEKQLAKRSFEMDDLGSITVARDSARVFRYPGTNDFVAIWRRAGQALEARGVAPGVDAFRSVVGSMRSVTVDAWLAAMPASVVKPASLSEVVDEMLTGLPLPSGFDVEALQRGTALRDRYQLGARVSGAVACAWIGGWIDARRRSDESGVREAVQAMASSRTWPILHEMDEQGAYPEVLWGVAQAMETGVPLTGGGQPMPVKASYFDALGCGTITPHK